MCTAYFQIINFTLFTLYSWNDWQDALQGSVMQKRPTWSHFQMSLLSAILPCECPMVWVTELQDQEAQEAALQGCPVSPSHSNFFHHCVPLFDHLSTALTPFLSAKHCVMDHTTKTIRCFQCGRQTLGGCWRLHSHRESRGGFKFPKCSAENAVITVPASSHVTQE